MHFISMKKIKYFAALITILFCLNSFGQKITNVRVSQEGISVSLLYDLEGKKDRYDVTLFYTLDDGKTWQGPLKNVTGDVAVQLAGTNKKVIWDAEAEKGQIEGFIQFKLNAQSVNLKNQVADKPIAKLTYSPEYYKYKKSKTIWLSGALVSGGIGVFSMIQANNYYTQYQTATTTAADLHRKVKLYDQITPIAFGVAGLCTLEIILKSGKQAKAKKQSLSFTPLPIKNGVGIGLAYTF